CRGRRSRCAAGRQRLPLRHAEHRRGQDRTASRGGRGPMSSAAELDATPENWRELIRPNADGLVPVIVQEATSREVLMLAWMDVEAVERTLATGRATYWSRSRGEYWVKGETSGHVQHVRSLSLDCDADTLLLLVDQTGPACHTNTPTCFTGRTNSADCPGRTADPPQPRTVPFARGRASARARPHPSARRFRDSADPLPQTHRRRTRQLPLRTGH